MNCEGARIKAQWEPFIWNLWWRNCHPPAPPPPEKNYAVAHRQHEARWSQFWAKPFSWAEIICDITNMADQKPIKPGDSEVRCDHLSPEVIICLFVPWGNLTQQLGTVSGCVHLCVCMCARVHHACVRVCITHACTLSLKGSSGSAVRCFN